MLYEVSGYRINKLEIDKLYFYLFLILCFMQILTIFFQLNELIVSVLLYINFITGFLIILKNIKSIKYNSKILLLNIFLIISLLLITIFYNIFYEDMYDYLERGGVSTITKYSYGIVAWFFIGGGLAISIIGIKINKNNFFLLLTSLTFFLFIFKANGFNEIDYQALSTNGLRVDHLVLGFFLIYLIGISHSQVKGLGLFFIFIMNTLILLITGGRSDFFIYIVAAFIFYFIFDKGKSKFITASLITFIVTFFLIFSSLFSSGIMEKFDRFYRLDSSDSSLLARNEIFVENIKDLNSKIFISDPNYLIKKHGNLGEYIHNILSAWESYGLIFFLLISYIALSNLIFLYKYKSNLMKTRAGRFGVFIFIFCFLSILSSKSVFYYPFWFALGFISIYRSLTKNQYFE